MPGFNGTGPLGQGPVTGRGMGRCTGAVPAGAVPGRGFGFGFGMGRGFGRGRGRGFGPGPMTAWYGYAPPATEPVDEKTAIENQIKGLENQLEILNNRLNEIS
ncbi:MAG: DUF5320 domain-containing protein [Desulfonatronovibrionaceae bacterium]